jgi:hypothetical protein
MEVDTVIFLVGFFALDMLVFVIVALGWRSVARRERHLLESKALSGKCTRIE